jgi:hypothetical protein
MASAGVLWLRVIETAPIDEGCGIMDLFHCEFERGEGRRSEAMPLIFFNLGRLNWPWPVSQKKLPFDEHTVNYLLTNQASPALSIFEKENPSRVLFIWAFGQWSGPEEVYM